jgi:hypothetical protein
LLFWILLAAVIIVALYIGWTVSEPYGYSGRDWGEGFLAFIASCFFGSIISGLILVIVGASTTGTVVWKQVGTDTHNLTALGTNTQTAGRVFYLGRTYTSDGTINYITKGDDKSIRISSAPASSSVIFEDNQKPSVSITAVKETRDWLVPWDFSTRYSYEFHIPEGSVLEGYSVDANK